MTLELAHTAARWAMALVGALRWDHDLGENGRQRLQDCSHGKMIPNRMTTAAVEFLHPVVLKYSAIATVALLRPGALPATEISGRGMCAQSNGQSALIGVPMSAAQSTFARDQILCKK